VRWATEDAPPQIAKLIATTRPLAAFLLLEKAQRFAPTDPQLKNTYVAFGAHYDHLGYMQGVLPAGQTDRIFNGADDDGSGSTAMLAIAKAFATGPKPKRSLVFVWHSGEEAGLYGSRFNADFPVVPIEKTQAQLNMDMVGRDDCDNANGDYRNTVFVIGADRISTDLHNLIVEINAVSKPSLKLDYEMNDPNDPESVYTRSDHYSYAAKGIPIAFFTTGLHKDYHQVSDEVDKIQFPKMARIAQLLYETGFSIANTDRVLERDNKGPRSGTNFEGKLSR
jgi:Zn-dependent M28 family amino/carboxypeptidase